MARAVRDESRIGLLEDCLVENAMALKLKKTVAQMLAEANAEIETVAAADAIKLKDDPNIVL